MSSAARRRAQAVRSTPGSKTDPTMSKLAALRVELVAEADDRKAKALAHRAGSSKSARKRAAQRGASLITGNTSPIEVAIGATRPGDVPKFNTGSVQVMPPKGKVSRPKGYRLTPFRDYIPGNPGDWTDARSRDTSAASRAVLKPHWSSDMPDRNAMASETAKTVTRSHGEQVAYDADRSQGYLAYQTGAQRDVDDAARGVFRDGLGRVMRTTDMADCEVTRVLVRREVVAHGQATVSVEVEEFRRLDGMTPVEYARANGLPGIRRLAQVVSAEKYEKQQDATQRKADKADLRADKREQRELSKAARAGERAARKVVESAPDPAREDALAERRRLRTLAREILAHRGITKPTAKQVSGMLEFFETNMQRAKYTQGNLAVAA
jgi:hypothetical protein